MTAALTDADIDQLSEACDLDLHQFRRSHLETRVARALEQERLGEIAHLRDRLAVEDALRASFRRAVAISVTGYFRDAEQFDLLADALIGTPGARARPLRAWSAGCATGEEAWSIAATLERVRRAAGALVLGSDVLAENVRAARRLHPTIAELGGTRLPRGGVRVRFECRDIVQQGSPGAGWDIVLCRNVAIYLGAAQRRAMHELLARALGPHGLLLVGRSERLPDPRALGLRRIAPHLYRRVDA